MKENLGSGGGVGVCWGIGIGVGFFRFVCVVFWML